MQVTCGIAVNYTVKTCLRPSFKGFLGESGDSEDGAWLTLDLVPALGDDLEDGLRNQSASHAVIPLKALGLCLIL